MIEYYYEYYSINNYIIPIIETFFESRSHDFRQARELVDGVPLDGPLTSTITSASVTIKDVNDEPPKFNQNEYKVKLVENLPPGTPLPNLNMTVTDPDIVSAYYEPIVKC